MPDNENEKIETIGEMKDEYTVNVITNWPIQLL